MAIETEQWQPALADYNAVLELKPENTGTTTMMHIPCEQVLSLDANHVMASYARASCRNRQGDLVQAIGMVFMCVCVCARACVVVLFYTEVICGIGQSYPSLKQILAYLHTCVAEDYTYALERDASAHHLHAAVSSSKRRSLDPKRCSAVDVSSRAWHTSRGQAASQSLDLSGAQVWGWTCGCLCDGGHRRALLILAFTVLLIPKSMVHQPLCLRLPKLLLPPAQSLSSIKLNLNDKPSIKPAAAAAAAAAADAADALCQACLGAGSMAQAASLAARAPQDHHQDQHQQGTTQLRGDRHSNTSDLQPRMLWAPILPPPKEVPASWA
eukprot:1160622-Pelagomonas_calceolata.AAC.5